MYQSTKESFRFLCVVVLHKVADRCWFYLMEDARNGVVRGLMDGWKGGKGWWEDF